jgi:ABC-type transport system involved in multi-copper enzyme maturation permease subunit
MFAAYSAAWWVTVFALGAVALAGLIGAAWAAAGLFQARSLLRRELAAYFVSPIAYLVLVVFLAVTGFSFYETLKQLTTGGPRGVEYPMQAFLGNWWTWLVFLVIPPVLTMRLFAEERSTGTLEMLLTAPLRDWQIVLAKYLACVIFYLFMWLPTLVYLPILLALGEPSFQSAWTPYSIALVLGLLAVVAGLVMSFLSLDTPARLVNLGLLAGGAAVAILGGWAHYHYDARHILTVPAGIDPMPVLTAYLGLALAGAMFLALGLLVSSLVRSQLGAFLVALGLGLLFIVAGFWRPDLDAGSPLYQAIYFFSVPLHFQRDFCRGVIDTRPLVLYSSVALFSLFLTVRSLESRRWR